MGFNGKQSSGYSKPGGHRQSVPTKPANLPNGYLAKGYMDSDGEYDIAYIDNMAEAIGKQLANPDSEGNTASSKVRAYFDIVEATHHQFVNKGITDNAVRSQLATLKARAHNAMSKNTASKLFKDFITNNVDLVIKSSKEDLATNLTGFKQHFEAVVCYMH